MSDAKTVAPRLLSIMTPALYLLASGCFPCTSGLRKAGLRHEKPMTSGRETGPMSAAFANENNSRVAVEYKVKVNRAKEAVRWINLEAEAIRRALPEGFPEKACQNQWIAYSVHEGNHLYALSDAFVCQRVSRRPRWRLSTLRFMTTQFLEPTDVKRDGASVGIDKPAAPEDEAPTAEVCISLLVDFPETPGRDIITFRFPDRERRTWWGRAAQVLLPAAVACDITYDTLVLIRYFVGPNAPGVGEAISDGINKAVR